MTEDELKEIEVRASKATPGPWRASERTYGDTGLFVFCGDETNTTTAASFLTPNDAAFVAASRSDVPALCHEIRVLRASLRMLGYDPSTGLRESS